MSSPEQNTLAKNKRARSSEECVVERPPKRPRSFACTKIAQSRKLAARAAESLSGKCLLTHLRGRAQACHVMRRSTHVSHVISFEKAWGLGENELNPDASRNILFLTPTLYIHWHHGDWILIPDFQLIASLRLDYSGRISKKCINDLYGDALAFDYYMIPCETMKETYIQRPLPRHPDKSQSKLPHQDGTVFHAFPYDTIGKLRSHVYPHLVVVTAAQKLIQLRDDLDPGKLPALVATATTILLRTGSALSGIAVHTAARIVDKLFGEIIDLYETWVASASSHQSETRLGWGEDQAPGDSDAGEHPNSDNGNSDDEYGYDSKGGADEGDTPGSKQSLGDCVHHHQARSIEATSFGFASTRAFCPPGLVANTASAGAMGSSSSSACSELSIDPSAERVGDGPAHYMSEVHAAQVRAWAQGCYDCRNSWEHVADCLGPAAPDFEGPGRTPSEVLAWAPTWLRRGDCEKPDPWTLGREHSSNDWAFLRGDRLLVPIHSPE